MANKKCPKCGEDNPAEAVMCWACYTPLTSGGAVAVGGGVGAATLPRAGSAVGRRAAEDDGEKKKIDPRIFAALPVLLIIGLGSAYFSGAFGSPTDDGGITAPKDPGSTASRPSGGGSSTSINISPPVAPPSPGLGGGGGNPSSSPAPAIYTVLSSPNSHFETATMAVTATQQISSDNDAVNVARQARQSLKNGRWTRAQIVVFSDRQSAAAFVSYMSDRRGAPLSQSNYQELADKGAWSNAKAFMEWNGNSEKKPRYPYQNPNGWWGG